LKVRIKEPQRWFRALMTNFLDRGATGAIRAYQILSKPFYDVLALVGVEKICRFEPSCSEYTRQAIEKHGLLRGGRMGIERIVRCNPWNHDCRYDPVE
jgi:putative membrane protein insertion efficiency factor